MSRIVSVTQHTGRQRPWGWEIPTTFVDDAGDEHNEVLLFRRQGQPSLAEVDEMTKFRVAKIEAAEEVEIEPET